MTWQDNRQSWMTYLLHDSHAFGTRFLRPVEFAAIVTESSILAVATRVSHHVLLAAGMASCMDAMGTTVTEVAAWGWGSGSVCPCFNATRAEGVSTACDTFQMASSNNKAMTC
jgi:hypothetical protein